MFWNILVLTTALFLSVTSHGTENPTVVNVPLNKAYVPVGFDDNDKVQVTVQGAFPSTCYKVAGVKAEVDDQTKKVILWQTAYYYSSETCTQMVVPFTQVVDVGLVAAGDYGIFDGASAKQLGGLAVSRATNPGPDDFLYAPINDALVIVDAVGRKTLVLLGEFSDRCTKLKEVNVHYYPEVIVAQPVAERLGERCASATIRFTKRVDLDSSLQGTYLLHVRAMNGQAINKIVDVSFLER